MRENREPIASEGLDQDERDNELLSKFRYSLAEHVIVLIR